MTHFLLRLIGALAVGCVSVIVLMLIVGHLLALPNNELVFTGDLGPRYSVIYRMDIAHRLIQRVRSETLYDLDPVWSPDGRQIAFVSVTESSQTAIYVMDAEGNRLYRLHEASLSDFSPTWSPNGQQIAFIRRYNDAPELMLTDFQSGLTRQLTDNISNKNNPTWSRDNQYLTFASNSADLQDIYNLDVQTGKTQLVFATTTNLDYPSWSPDGRYLLYIANGRNAGIYLWDTVSLKSILLNPTRFTPTNAPDWSEDGRFIVYAAATQLRSVGIFQLDVGLCLQAPDSCMPKLLTSPSAFYQSPRWRPQTP